MARKLSNTPSAVRGRKWYRKNRAKKLKYEKTRQSDNTSRHTARRKVAKKRGKSAVKDKDVHHIDGNPKNNKLSNLQTVKRHHSKVKGRVKSRRERRKK